MFDKSELMTLLKPSRVDVSRSPTEPPANGESNCWKIAWMANKRKPSPIDIDKGDADCRRSLSTKLIRRPNMAVLRSGKAAWLPVGFALMMLMASLVSYIAAVAQGHVQPFLPFISEAGGHLPESGVFGIFLSFSVMLGTIMVLIRYHTVRDFNSSGSKLVTLLNIVGLGVGLAAFSGLLVVANYPINHRPCEEVNGTWISSNSTTFHFLTIPHLMGAMFLFYGFIFYMALEALVTFLLFRNLVAYIRGALFFLALGINISMTLVGVPSNSDSSRPPVAQIAEWLVGVSMVAFALTYVGDFARVSLSLHVACGETLAFGSAGGRPSLP